MKDQMRSTDSDVYSIVMYTELFLGLTFHRTLNFRNNTEITYMKKKYQKLIQSVQTAKME